MIALLLAAQCCAQPSFAQLFWQRELGLLKRALLDDRAPPAAAEERLLFEDLLALATCAPLPPLAQPSPMRQLVRIEAGRRARLGKAAGTSRTLWRDLLRPGFFTLAVPNPKPSKALYWPEEKEKWPEETLLTEAPAWLCARAKAEPAEEAIGDELLLALSQQPRTVALLAYERAAVQLRQGKALEASALEVAQLPEDLQPYGRFLRLEAGADPREGFAALARELPQPIVIDRAAQALFEAGKFEAVVALTQEKPPRYALWVRALSLSRLGREDEMLDALARAFALPGPETGTEPLRELAVQTLARRPLDEKKLMRFAVKDGEGALLLQLGQRALAANNLQTARAAAQALADFPRARTSAAGLALQGEAAFAAGDAAGVRDALAMLFPEGGGYGRGAVAVKGASRAPALVRIADRDERDRAAVALAQALAGRAAKAPLAGLLDEAFARMRDGVHVRHAREIDLASEGARLAVVKDAQRVAIGEIKVEIPPQLPPAPKAALELPEPFSLLAVPHDDGSLRSWFESPEVADAR